MGDVSRRSQCVLIMLKMTAPSPTTALRRSGIFDAEKLAAFNDAQFPQTLLEQIAEAMGIYAGTRDHERFVPQAEQLLRSFEASEGHPAVDYLEIEQWSKFHLDPSGKFLVLSGGMQVKPLTEK
jgi:hypothetical protein